jgi:hypothetical protein
MLPRTLSKARRLDKLFSQEEQFRPIHQQKVRLQRMDAEEAHPKIHGLKNVDGAKRRAWAETDLTRPQRTHKHPAKEALQARQGQKADIPKDGRCRAKEKHGCIFNAQPELRALLGRYTNTLKHILNMKSLVVLLFLFG